MNGRKTGREGEREGRDEREHPEHSTAQATPGEGDHHHGAAAMQQLAVSGAAGVEQVNAAAAMASHAALPDGDDQHGLAAIAGMAGTTTAATTTARAPLRMQHFMAQDYAGLLQDMFPSFVHNDDDGHHDNHH